MPRVPRPYGRCGWVGPRRDRLGVGGRSLSNSRARRGSQNGRNRLQKESNGHAAFAGTQLVAPHAAHPPMSRQGARRVHKHVSVSKRGGRIGITCTDTPDGGVRVTGLLADGVAALAGLNVRQHALHPAAQNYLSSIAMPHQYVPHCRPQSPALPRARHGRRRSAISSSRSTVSLSTLTLRRLP